MNKLLLIGLLALAGCGEKHMEFPRPPVDRLICDPEPGAPQERGANGRVTDEAAARYMFKLRAAGQDCRDDVYFMRDWFEALDRAAKAAKVK